MALRYFRLTDAAAGNNSLLKTAMERGATIKKLAAGANIAITDDSAGTLTIATVSSALSLSDNDFTVTAAADATKTLLFSLSGETTGKAVTIAASNTNNATITLPNATATLATLALAESLSNKTLVAPVLGAATATSINGIIITTGTSTLTLAGSAQTFTSPAATDTLVGRASTDTLTNKTITDAIFSTTVRCTATISATSGSTGTTLTNVTGLTIPVTASGVYAFRAYLATVSTANSGLKLAIANSGTTTSTSYSGKQYNGTSLGANSTTTTMGNAVAAATAVTTDAVIEGTVVVNGAGNLTVQFAQNASHADTTSVFANSYFTATRIA